jgi:hypothetical protein
MLVGAIVSAVVGGLDSILHASSRVPLDVKDTSPCSLLRWLAFLFVIAQCIFPLIRLRTLKASVHNTLNTTILVSLKIPIGMLAIKNSVTFVTLHPIQGRRNRVSFK